MTEVEFKVRGMTIRGYQWWSPRTIPPTLMGTTFVHALAIAEEALGNTPRWPPIPKDEEQI